MRYTAVLLVVSVIALYETLNFSGYCYSSKCFISRQRLIDIAVAEEQRRISKTRTYANENNTVDDFYRRYGKGCCSIYWWSDAWEPMYLKFISSSIFQTYYTVYVEYDDTSSHYYINSCGVIRGRRSIQ